MTDEGNADKPGAITEDPLQRGYFGLIVAAARGNFEKVDAELTEEMATANIAAAPSLLEDRNQDVRDFAATTLEKSNAPLPEGAEAKLLKVVKTDSYKYARIRAAFALYKRGIHPQEVLDTVHAAEQDEDEGVAAIAKSYIENNIVEPKGV